MSARGAHLFAPRLAVTHGIGHARALVLDWTGFRLNQSKSLTKFCSGIDPLYLCNREQKICSPHSQLFADTQANVQR